MNTTISYYFCALEKTCHLYYSLTLDVVKEPFDDAIEYTTTTLHILQHSHALFFSGVRFAGCKQGELRRRKTDLHLPTQRKRIFFVIFLVQCVA